MEIGKDMHPWPVPYKVEGACNCSAQINFRHQLMIENWENESESKVLQTKRAGLVKKTPGRVVGRSCSYRK